MFTLVADRLGLEGRKANVGEQLIIIGVMK